MANDIVFKKKAFGGFDRDEVMNYINDLLRQKSESDKRLAEVTAENAELSASLQQYKQAADSAQALNDEIQDLKSQVDVFTATVTDKDVELSILSEKLLQKDAEITELEKKLSETAVSEEVQAELDSLRAEISRLRIELEKKKDLERQVGAAMLDARIHSEELVEEAKQKANDVTKTVYTAIGDTALRIDDLSGSIGEIARSFAKSVEEVELRIKALTGDMSKTAQLLISESGVITDTTPVTEPVIEVTRAYDFTQRGESVTEVTFETHDSADDTGAAE